MAIEKADLAALVNAALSNDRVVDDRELQDILDQASVGGISAEEIIGARELLHDSGTELIAAQAGLTQADANLKSAEDRWSIVDGARAAGDRFKAKMALTEAQGRYNAYEKLADALYVHASPGSRGLADANSSFKEHVAPIGHAVRDFFKQF
jgi:hypothetical protein